MGDALVWRRRAAPRDTDDASEDEFIPTEELPPDSAIDFPVDI